MCLLYHEFAALHKTTLPKTLPEHKGELDFSSRAQNEVEQTFLQELKTLEESLEAGGERV